MDRKKQIPFLLSVIFIIALLFSFDREITVPNLATDLGFDTSDDYGGS